MNKFEIYQPINFDNFIWSTEEPLLFPANDCLKFDGEDSPLQTSKNTFLSSGEENGLSFDIDSFTDKQSESQSVSKKSTCFNDAAYEEVAEIVHSDDTDLNLLLEDVLSAGPVDPTVKRVKRKNPLLKKKQMKRTRKSKDQVEKLMEAYKRNDSWEKADVLELSHTLGLKSSQVYKWYWDQQKKDGRLTGKRW